MNVNSPRFDCKTFIFGMTEISLYHCSLFRHNNNDIPTQQNTYKTATKNHYNSKKQLHNYKTTQYIITNGQRNTTIPNNTIPQQPKNTITHK